MGNVLFQSLPSILMVLLLGPWTDTGGRRPALLAPPLGSALEAIIILLIMYLEWPVYVLFVGEAINGFSGFATIMTMAAFSYVSDITTEKGLALHIGQYIFLIYRTINTLTSHLANTAEPLIPVPVACGRRGSLVVSALDSGSRGPGSSRSLVIVLCS